MGHPPLRHGARTAVGPPLPHAVRRARLSLRGPGAGHHLRRLRHPALTGRHGETANRRAARISLLAPVPRAAVRRDHGGHDRTPLIPGVLTVLVVVVYLRGARARRSWPPWRSGLFLLGLVALLAALASPIDSIALQLFSVHMVQHMLLLAVAAPLLLAGSPVRPLLRG